MKEMSIRDALALNKVINVTNLSFEDQRGLIT